MLWVVVSWKGAEKDIGEEEVFAFAAWSARSDDESLFGACAGDIEKTHVLGVLLGVYHVVDVVADDIFSFEAGESLAISEVRSDRF